MTELDKAAERFQAARAELDAARLALSEAVADAARSGVQQAKIARVTGYTRETVRRICREAGIEPDRT